MILKIIRAGRAAERGSWIRRGVCVCQQPYWWCHMQQVNSFSWQHGHKLTAKQSSVWDAELLLLTNMSRITPSVARNNCKHSCAKDCRPFYFIQYSCRMVLACSPAVSCQHYKLVHFTFLGSHPPHDDQSERVVKISSFFKSILLPLYNLHFSSLACQCLGSYLEASFFESLINHCNGSSLKQNINKELPVESHEAEEHLHPFTKTFKKSLFQPHKAQ